jgi:hypothetical protein
MNPGKLDRAIEILEPVIKISGDSGGASEDFRAVAQIWGARSDQVGREYRAAGALNADITATFTIRYREGLTTRHRLRCEGKDYDILEIGETGARRTFFLVQTKARLP